jgi:glucose-1-phosphate cytidylyltransferase
MYEIGAGGLSLQFHNSRSFELVMKVVLFCGGFGMRMREYSEAIPKPLVNIGYRPILWHIMKYYAHFGHREFILCLGWKANAIKEYFLSYNECLSNDFVLTGGGDSVRLLNRDIDDWTITFVDTGGRSSIGERLRRVAPLLEGEKTFLANYTDGLTDLDLPQLIRFHYETQSVATFQAVRPSQSFHMITADAGGRVRDLTPVGNADVWMNGGFFVLDREIFTYLRPGDDLVDQAFRRLAAEGRLTAFKHEGFWGCMDTFKEHQALDERMTRGDAPWEVWKTSGITGAMPTADATPWLSPDPVLHLPLSLDSGAPSP